MQYVKVGSAKDVQIVSNEQATISGLTPSTEYIISVAAVNSADTGPYSDEVAHKTASEYTYVHRLCLCRGYSATG